MHDQPITPQTARTLILAECAGALAAFAGSPDALPDDFDLRESGVVDSLGFIELISSLEDRLNVEIDLDAVEAEELTRLGALSALVAAQAAAAAAPAVDPVVNGHAPTGL